MGILLLKAFREKDFGHKLKKIRDPTENLINIVDKKQVGIKDAIKIISSLNASQRLLVSEALKLVKLILTYPPIML